MAGNPRIVTEDTEFTWDGSTQRLPRGQVIDVPAGSALEEAIGPDHLVPLGAVAAQPAPEAPAAEEPQDPPEADEDTTPPPPARSKRTATQAPADEAPDAGEGDAM